MNVRPFDFRPISLCRRVVDHQQQALWQGQCPQNQRQQSCRDKFALASDGDKKIIVVLEVVAYTGGAEPSGNGSPSAGKQNAEEQHRQSPSIACMQPGCQPLAPIRPIVRTLPTTFPVSPSLALPSCGFFAQRSMTEEPFLLKINLWFINGLWPFFSESAEYYKPPQKHCWTSQQWHPKSATPTFSTGC